MSILINPYSLTVAGTRYWRVITTAVGSGNFVAIAELEFRNSPGGSNLASGGVASASSTFSGAAVPAYAFDNDPVTFWASANVALPAWLRYDFPSSVDIVEIAIRAKNDGLAVNQSPNTFRVQSSLDGSGWADVWSITSTGWTAGVQRIFTRP